MPTRFLRPNLESLEDRCVPAASPAAVSGGLVSVGDVTGDRVPDAVVGTSPGQAPRVTIFDGRTGLLVGRFFAFDRFLRNGVQVLIADTTGDGVAEILTAQPRNALPFLRIYDGRSLALIDLHFFYASPSGTARLLSVNAGLDFFSLQQQARSFLDFGVQLTAAADFDQDGSLDLALTTGPGGPPQVLVANCRTTATVSSFYVGRPFGGGTTSASLIDFGGDGKLDLLVRSGSRTRLVSIYDPLTGAMLAQMPG